ncbi:hypothetical protein DICA3_E12244 [Diutina catenulata]
MPFTKHAQKQLASDVDAILVSATNDPVQGIHAVACGVTDAKGTVYLNGKGVKNNSSSEAATKDSMFMLFSCTKAMTVMGALILYDQGKLNFDVPISSYVPQIADVYIVEEGTVDLETGEFLSPPKKPNNPVTARNLITHTAGFSYGFLNPEYLALAKRDKSVSAVKPTRALFAADKMPLTFEPGTQWSYGHNIDWLGIVIEELSGMKLGQFLEKHLFKPAGMDNTSFYFNDYDKSVRLHMRRGNGDLKFMKNYPLYFTPEQDMGGQGCWGTVGDYLKFIRVYLNGGTTDNGTRIVRRRTLEYALTNHLAPSLGVNPAVNDFGWDMPENAELDGFTLTGHGYTANDMPSGRPKGSVYWSGLGNLYYWIDVENKVGGFWAEQILPFLDPESTKHYRQFETAVYNHLSKKHHL